MLYGIFMSVMTCLCWGSTSVMMRGIHKLGAFEVSLLRAAGGLVCGSALFFAFHGGAAPGLRLGAFLRFPRRGGAHLGA